MQLFLNERRSSLFQIPFSNINYLYLYYSKASRSFASPVLQSFHKSNSSIALIAPYSSPIPLFSVSITENRDICLKKIDRIILLHCDSFHFYPCRRGSSSRKKRKEGVALCDALLQTCLHPHCCVVYMSGKRNRYIGCALFFHAPRFSILTRLWFQLRWISRNLPVLLSSNRR